jgi:hypothetical protein
LGFKIREFEPPLLIHGKGDRPRRLEFKARRRDRAAGLMAIIALTMELKMDRVLLKTTIPSLPLATIP